VFLPAIGAFQRHSTHSTSSIIGLLSISPLLSQVSRPLVFNKVRENNKKTKQA
jgi:hypothetical protein